MYYPFYNRLPPIAGVFYWNNTMRKATTKTVAGQKTFQTRDFSAIKNHVLFFSQQLTQKIKHAFSSLSQDRYQQNNRKFKKIIPLAILFIAIGVTILISARALRASTQTTSQDARVQIKGPKASTTINKEFSFPLLDAKGKEITRLTYLVESAELRDEIIVKGTRATAIQGRTFLIVSIKISNNFDKALQINARDYIRLAVNGENEELLAADIHNDPVQVQPISVKTTRIGFPINDTDKNITLKVGEIKGDKEDINLSF